MVLVFIFRFPVEIGMKKVLHIFPDLQTHFQFQFAFKELLHGIINTSINKSNCIKINQSYVRVL